MIRPATYNAHQVASIWSRHVMTVYRDHKVGKLPVAPFRVGHSLRWSRAAVLASVGLDLDSDPFADDAEPPVRSAKS
jgi:hypothetical protein